MPDVITQLAEWCAAVVEALGIGIITLISIYALLDAAFRLFRRHPGDDVVQELRQRLGRGILVGLEFLIAADIIHTVALDFTFENLGVLAIIVLIRTFLSIALEVELTGRWPWRTKKE